MQAWLKNGSQNGFKIAPKFRGIARDDPKKAYGTNLVKVFQMHDVTMGSFAAASSMKGIIMSVEQSFKGDANGIHRSQTVTLKLKKRDSPPHPSLLMPEKEPQAHVPEARLGRLDRLRHQFSRLPLQRRQPDPIRYHKRAISTCRRLC
jgi:hypothetical protein